MYPTQNATSTPIATMMPEKKKENDEKKTRPLDNSVGRLVLRNDRHTQTAIMRLEHQLLVPPRFEILHSALDQNEPAHNHQDICEPITAREIQSVAAVGDLVLVEIVRVGIWWRGVAILAAHVRGGITDRGSLHVESILNQRDAEAGPGAILGSVGRMEQVREQEADKLEGGRDHAIPDEREHRADGEAVDVNLVGTAEAGRENGSFPIWWHCVGSSLLIGGWLLFLLRILPLGPGRHVRKYTIGRVLTAHDPRSALHAIGIWVRKVMTWLCDGGRRGSGIVGHGILPH